MQNVVSEEKAQTPVISQECAMISEKQFMRDHTFYSAASSWLFAIAGATNIGVLIDLSSKVLRGAEKGQPLSVTMSNKKYNRVALLMTAFGGLCMGISNWLESRKVVTEWQLGAGKMQRKMNIADERIQKTAAGLSTANTPIDQILVTDISALPSQPKDSMTSVPREHIDSVSKFCQSVSPGTLLNP